MQRRRIRNCLFIVALCLMSRWLSASISRAFSARLFPKPGTLLPEDEFVEEENVPDYQAQDFYPAYLGETLNNRYEVLSKLGYGRSSTVWLARDTTRWRWQSHRYVAIKILSIPFSNQGSLHDDREVQISRSLATTQGKGSRFLNHMLDYFSLPGYDSDGTHNCFVYEPMRGTISLLQNLFPERKLPIDVVKPFLKFMLMGLQHMHEDCHVIHTDIKPANILLSLESPKVLQQHLSAEESSPSSYKFIDDTHKIYRSRPFSSKWYGFGVPKLTDFTLAVWGNVSSDKPWNHDIQPNVFMAPEVILRATWSYPADIWNLGAMMWNLLEDTDLFSNIDPVEGMYTRQAHLTKIINFLGPPPANLLSRGLDTSLYFDPEGIFQYQNLSSHYPSALEDTISSIEGKEKKEFLEFIHKMLVWAPEKRWTASRLLRHPYLDGLPDG